MNFAALEDEIENKTGELLTLRGELDSRDEALGDLEKLIEELQNECATLRFSAASLEDLEGSVSEKETHIADLNAELARCRQEIKTLEARNREIESRGTVLQESEGISALESDLQEVSQMLRETRAHLTELPTLIAQSTPETRDSPTSEIQPVEIQLESKQLSPATITELEVVKDGRIQQVMKVADSQSRIMIGRAEDSDLCLDSGFVSRHHALVFCSEQGTYIEDLNSFNGTIVNSGKSSRCELQPGDVVAIGDFQIKPR